MNLGEGHAQGLYILHQAVLDKELKAPIPDTSMIASALVWAVAPKKINNVKVHCKLQCTFNQAAAELHCLQKLSPGSHKWNVLSLRDAYMSLQVFSHSQQTT